MLSSTWLIASARSGYANRRFAWLNAEEGWAFVAVALLPDYVLELPQCLLPDYNIWLWFVDRYELTDHVKHRFARVLRWPRWSLLHHERHEE
jgi:hypothetical protein